MYPKIWSLHRNWNPFCPKVAKVLLVQTYLEISIQIFQKPQLWILVSGSELTLSYYYRTLTLKKLSFWPLQWLEFFHQDLDNFFFSKAALFYKINSRMFNLSFLCRLDGNFCSAFVVLVDISHRNICYEKKKVSQYLIFFLQWFANSGCVNLETLRKN